MTRETTVLALLALLASFLVMPSTGCSKKKAVSAPGGADGRAATARRRAAPTERARASSSLAPPALQPIYFDYDTAALKPESRATLDELATYMRQQGHATVTIAGHADERGTPEYNLALGEERARTAQRYLVRSGVAAQRISIISYGEERPAVRGAGEESWAQNRRDDFDLVTGARASR